MKLTFIGHAAVLLEGSASVLIDPFFTNNPSAAFAMDRLPKIDIVLATHDHFDHLGDAISLAKKHDATVVAIHELATCKAVVDAKIRAVGMNIGGTYAHGGVRVSMTWALHSSSLGTPCGFVVESDGKRVYHAGDTALYSDMQLIPKLFGKIDVACLPIGGHYVMDAKQAAMAVKMLKPKIAVPIHYNTWPVIHSDPNLFARLAKPSRVSILAAGESMDL